MNKYLIVGIIAVVVIGGGIFYRTTLLSEDKVPLVTGVVHEVAVVAKKNEWRFVPEEIEINHGDHVIMTVINEDDYDHGIAIDSYGVSQRMPANSTRVIEFDATQQGDFPFYCSVPCGEGEVDGVLRTHFDMIGKLHVKSLISETR
ncbi:MAG: cupredoxin domain-containing protein [bacterium]|nr:cupredoxin domain-containing protein [bacterium]MDZ4284201.1 cupredoxin domain-containing protein [Patescibacteria group bacterium]